MEPVRIEQFLTVKTLVLMSIGSDRGKWWADPDFGSDLWKLRQTGKTGPEMVKAVRQEILRCTKWIVQDGLVQTIECETYQNGRNRIDWKVIVTYLDGATEIIGDTWNGIE